MSSNDGVPLVRVDPQTIALEIRRLKAQRIEDGAFSILSGVSDIDTSKPNWSESVGTSWAGHTRRIVAAEAILLAREVVRQIDHLIASGEEL